MKRDRFTVSDQEEGQRRLDHYNAWLMDPARPVDGKPYPGYPEQKSAVKAVTVAQEPKKRHNKRIATHTSKGNAMSKVTNLSRATEIVKATGSKAEALEKIMAELSVTRSNAFVYFTKATKALGQPVGEKPAKAAKVTKVKVNPVTETSPEKVAKKVAEIDKVIAGLKASGATVASPFAALGA